MRTFVHTYVRPYLRVRSSVLTRTFIYINDGMAHFFQKQNGPFSGPVHRERVPKVRVRASVLTDFFFLILEFGLGDFGWHIKIQNLIL